MSNQLTRRDYYILEEQAPTFVFHYRLYDGRDTPSPPINTGGFTITATPVAETCPGKTVLRCHLSVCSRKDAFNRKTGLALANGQDREFYIEVNSFFLGGHRLRDLSREIINKTRHYLLKTKMALRHHYAFPENKQCVLNEFARPVFAALLDLLNWCDRNKITIRTAGQ